MYKSIKKLLKFPKEINEYIEVSYSDREAYKKLGQALCSYLNKDTIILCIGSTKLNGDSLGPRVGSCLVKEGIGLPVFGTVENPIHALNLEKAYKSIRSSYENPSILAVDAAISQRTCKVGCVSLIPKALSAGTGVHKELISVGSSSIVGFVCAVNDNSLYFPPLAKVDLNFVDKIASVIVDSILFAYRQTCGKKTESTRKAVF